MQANQVRLARRVRLVVMSSVLLLSAGGVSGEPTSERTVVVGSRIRLLSSALGSQPVRGTVADVGADRLTIRTDSQEQLVVPRSSIGRLDISTGQHRQTIRGILIGTVAGAALSVVLPKCVNEGCSSGASFDSTFAVLYAFGGAMCGGLIGTAIKTEGWRAVPLNSMRVGITPRAGRGIGVAVSIDLRRHLGRRTRG